MKTRFVFTCLLLTCLLLLVLAGCMEPSVEGDDTKEPSLRILGGPTTPVVVFGTSEPGRVNWYLHAIPDCVDTATSRATVYVFDRNGLVSVFKRDFAGGSFPAENISLSLAGEPPWLVAGDGPACGWNAAMALEGITEGRALPEQRIKVELRVPVEVRAGQAVGEVAWEPGPYVWSLLQVVHWSEDRQGEQYGKVSMIDAEGNVTRWDSYSPLGDDFRYHTYVLVDGTYKIRLELDRPALMDTVWMYTIQYMELSAAVCEDGFAWPDLCQGS